MNKAEIYGFDSHIILSLNIVYLALVWHNLWSQSCEINSINSGETNQNANSINKNLASLPSQKP